MNKSRQISLRSFFSWAKKNFFVLAIIFEAPLMVIIAVLISYLYAGELLLNPILFDLEGLGLGIAATLPMVAYIIFSLSPFGRNLGSLKRIYEILRDILSKYIIEMHTWQLAVLGMSAGIGEECLFRGALQPLVEGWTAPLNAILITGFIFGLIHALTPTYFILATAISIYLGFLAEYTGNLLPPILAHGIYDIIALILLKREFLRDLPPADEPGGKETGGDDRVPEGEKGENENCAPEGEGSASTPAPGS